MRARTPPATRTHSGNRGIGQVCEARAEAYLVAEGYTPLAHSYFARVGEVDLIMRDKHTIVFIEVKYRATDRFGTALEAITPAKMRKVYAAAMHYLETNTITAPYRFDIIAIDGEKITHEKNIPCF